MNANPYDHAFTPSEKKLVELRMCPMCESPLYAEHREVFCSNEEEDGHEEPKCGFWTSRDFIKYQLGHDPFPPPFQLQVPKRRV